MHIVIGVMGGGGATNEVLEAAYELGRGIAERGWVLLNGGRDCGVMQASAHGARDGGGLSVGVLPGDDLEGVSPYIDIPLPTGLGDGRNFVNVTASRVVVALPGGAGTLSEVALALKQGKTVIALDFDLGAAFEPYVACGRLLAAATPAETLALLEHTIAEGA